MTAARLESLRDVVQRDIPLGPLTTYRFGGPARFFAEVATVAQLMEVVAARMEDQRLPMLLLGKGSNVVVADRGFDGLVIRLVGDFTAITVADDGTVFAGAAATLPRLARESVRAGRGGLEWCVGIPGTVGGAVRMNAGGHGSDTASWLIDAEVVDAGTLHLERHRTSELGLAYRRSGLSANEIVTSARFRTTRQDTAQGEAHLRDITRWRREHQPGGTLNAGSVFKNPPGDTAGRIIDSLGLKGFSVGGASVSTKHANFFVAREGATAQDVYDLVGAVRRNVREATGVDLETEIRFVGDFGGTGDPGAAP